MLRFQIHPKQFAQSLLQRSLCLEARIIRCHQIAFVEQRWPGLLIDVVKEVDLLIGHLDLDPLHQMGDGFAEVVIPHQAHLAGADVQLDHVDIGQVTVELAR